MAIANTLDDLRDLFYRSKFNELFRQLDRIQDEVGTITPEQSLIKANALFEVHDVDSARETLKSIRQTGDGFDAGYSYALARLAYLDDDQKLAREIVTDILKEDIDEYTKFRTLLGIANTYYTEREFLKIPPIIEQLSKFEPIPWDDVKISYLIFLGNYYFASGASTELAKNYFRKALSGAAAKAWTFFIARSLYGIAAVAEKNSNTTELMWTLDILQSFVDESEQKYFAHIVNKKFKSYFAIKTPMEFDADNQRILIKDKWVGFHDKSMLFKFLLLLHKRQSFVTKGQIADELWADEPYKPRIHDPRIFDIAKRARNMVEAYENQPVVLLSGRMGYKLASI